MFGGNITIYTKLCEQARDDAFRDMITHANQLSANAVIGVRYDATELAPGITEVLCYGTAVQVEPCRMSSVRPRQRAKPKSPTAINEFLWQDTADGPRSNISREELTPSGRRFSPS